MPYKPGKDWRAELGRHEGRAAHETLSDQITAIKLVFRVLTFPIWLPLYIRKVEKRRRAMLAFATERSRDRILSDELVSEVAMEWMTAHSEQYPLGEYDPRFARLQRTFKSMLERQMQKRL